MDGQEGWEQGSASKFPGSSRDGDGDGHRDWDRVAQVHLPNLALFHMAFLSHPKPKVCLTPKAQSGDGALPLVHPNALPCHEPSGDRAGSSSPSPSPWHCRAEPRTASKPSAVPSWGHGLVAGCPCARVVWHHVPSTCIFSVPGLSHRNPTSQVAMPHWRRHDRFSSCRVRSVFCG